MKEITQVGNKVMRQKAKKVKFPLQKDDKKVIRDLLKTMNGENKLVGIAAPQIGISKQIFITHPKSTKWRKIDNEPEKVFINAKITRYSRKKVLGYEGCGSVADTNWFGNVPRSENIDIEFYTENGEGKKETFSGFVARIIQHEIDHTNGVIFVDRVVDTKSFMTGSEYKKAIK